MRLRPLILLCSFALFSQGASATLEFKRLVKELKVTSPASGGASTPAPSGGGNASPSDPGTPTAPAGVPQATLSTMDVSFGKVATNYTSTKQVLLHSTGTAPLTVTALPWVDGDTQYRAGNTSCGEAISLAPDLYCVADVIFSPTVVGAVSGTLKIATNTKSEPLRVTLTGEGYNPLSLSGATLPVAKLNRSFSFDFKPLLRVDNEPLSIDKAGMQWSASSLPKGLTMSSGVVSGTPTVKTSTSGTDATVAVTFHGNDTSSSYTFRVLDTFMDVFQASSGTRSTTCVVTNGGAVKCWGFNSQGQTGSSPASTQVLTPYTVISSGATNVSVGLNSACAVMTTGTVKCWGDGYYGQLGNGTSGSVTAYIPVTAAGVTDAVKVSVGDSFACAVTRGGNLYCWGTNGSGQLGDNSTIQRNTPVLVNSGVKSVSAGVNHTCAVLSDSRAACWGAATSGAIGNGASSGRQLTPYVVMSDVAQIEAGTNGTCAIALSGAVYCWGYNAVGQLGNGTTSDRLTPGQVTGITSGAQQISLGNLHTCAIVNSNAYCWGSNGSGRLGDGTTTARTTPVLVQGSTGSASVLAGMDYTCVTTAYGSMKCLGANTNGQLGDGTTTLRSTLTEILE